MSKRTIFDDIKDQHQVLKMLQFRDEMNAAVHGTEVRLSPVTEAAQRVMTSLNRQARGSEKTANAIMYDVNGTKKHEFVALWPDDADENPICAVVNCVADGETDVDGGEQYRNHTIHKVRKKA